MEVKVFVEGVPRVVCGVTDHTTCQEVVIALAQALGRPGRYTLKEKFKDFERCMSPSELLLEALQKYGEHGKEVQLTLLLNNNSSRPPLLWDPAPGGRTTDLRDLPGAPLRRRRPDPGSRARKGSGSLSSSAHRQSLPVLSRLRQEEEEAGPLEEVKRPKRKSLTLMDAWGWLGSLGRGRLHYCVSDPEGDKKTGKERAGDLPEGSACAGSVASGSVGSKEDSGQDGFLSRVRRRKRERQCREHRASCCIGTQKTKDQTLGTKGQTLGPKDQTLGTKDQTLGTKDQTPGTKDQTLGTKDQTPGTKDQTPGPKDQTLESKDGAPGRTSRTDRLEDEKIKLREHITSQGSRLRELDLQISSVDRQIRELEGQQMERPARLDGRRSASEQEEEKEEEVVLFWEKELKTELGFERDIQAQFLEMREKARQCKAELEEYKRKVQRLAFTAGAKTPDEIADEEGPGILGKGVTKVSTAAETSVTAVNTVNTGRKETPSLPHAPAPPDQIKERRLTGPTELREWWKRWSESQSTAAQAQAPVHRTELTIYLGSAKV
ncbi:unnamed protein product [Lota lota]